MDRTARKSGHAETPWHSLTRQEVLARLESDDDGIGEDDARKRQGTYGKNELRKAARRSPAAIFAKQFTSPLIVILLAATVISAFLGEIMDAAIIMVIVILAAVVSFVQEYRSEKAIDALRQITSPVAIVVRSQRHSTIKSEDIVPGDIIVLSQGDTIPADAYVLESHALQTNEAALTGESMPVEKGTQPSKPEAPVAERRNIVYSGTTVTLGRGKAVAFGIGHGTELGKIATSVQTVERQKTPFEIRMSRIGKMLSLVMLGIVVIITLVGIYRGHSLAEMFVWGISVAVAAIPEALPAVIATSLTIGVYKMARRNAIVRRLPAVETLGAVTVICSDKTGTLTSGKMAVRKIYVGDTIMEASKEQLPELGRRNSDVRQLGLAAALCNDVIATVAELDTPTRGGIGSTVQPSMSHDPTEVALLRFSAGIHGLKMNEIDRDFPRKFEIPFSSERKRMTTVHSMANREQAIVITKGAPEVILDSCNRIVLAGRITELGPDDVNSVTKASENLASQALRVLAFSYKEMRTVNDGMEMKHLAQGLEIDHIFLGLVGIIDPPRSEAIDAIKQCRTAGIRVMMLTGDNKTTALAIAKEMGIVGTAESQSDHRVATGSDIDRMTDSDLDAALAQTRVFARVLPEHKLRITRALQRSGHVVALTGDGVNDAPALKAADIGVSMGMTGTQVAKESSSMVLADDNFATIVTAIEEGRRIMDNVKKYLVYLLSGNIGEILLLSSALIIGLPTPLLAKHVLYINLATDGSPAIALSAEPAERDIMRRMPQNPKKGIFSDMLVRLVGISLILGAVSLVLFWHTLSSNGWTYEAEAKARTMTFALIIYFEIFFAYSSRSLRSSFITMGVLKNKALLLSLMGEFAVATVILKLPALQPIFSLVPLDWSEWAQILILATAGFVFSEATKALMAFRQRNEGKALQNTVA